MNQRSRRYSSLGRPIDPAYPTNRAIAALSLGLLVLGLLLGLLGGATPPTAMLRGIVWAAGFFLAWALAREVDPDQPAAAFVAAGLSLVPLWLFDRPTFAVLFLLLLALRVVNRSTGPAAKPIDTVLILALAAFVTWQGHPVAVGVTAAAFLLDGLLDPPHKPHLVAAAVAVGLTVVAVVRSTVSGPGPDTMAWIALAGAAPFLLVIRRAGTPQSVSDMDGRPLRRARVRAAQVLALAAVVGAAFGGETNGLTAISSLWAAVAGTGLYAAVRGNR